MKTSSTPSLDLNGTEGTLMKKRKKPMVPVWVLRSIFALLIIGIIVSTAACKAGFGRICTFGVGEFVITCPLGYLGMVLASKSPLLNLLPGVGVGVLLVLVFGRAFCAWVCPGSIITTLKSRVGRYFLNHHKVNHVGKGVVPNGNPAALTGNHNGIHRDISKNSRLAGLAILVGTLASSYVFGFPVFCLVCPVGLVFGIVFAVIRLFHSAPPGLELLVFPAMLVVEFFLIKSWCASFCPLGALYSLIGSLNRPLRLHVEEKECLLERGVNCRACERSCSEGIYLPKSPSKVNPAECSKCLDCYEKCPVKAIHLRAL
jgi:ferredoxin-type protein NapH